MSLDQAVTAMAAAANDEVVGLVIRWNQDDTKVRTLWSEQPNKAAHPANPQAEQRTARLIRFNDDKTPGLGTRIASRVGDITGYHAEELMISCWPGLIGAVGLTEAQIRSVDLVLSKSPCYGEAGSSVLTIETNPGVNAERYEQSCAMKLYRFCGSRSNVRFQISYISMAGAKAGSYALGNLGRGLAGSINALMTDEEARLQGPRKEVARLQASRNDIEQSRADAGKTLQELKRQLADPTTSAGDKARIGPQLKQLGGDISKLGAKNARLNDPIHVARGEARAVSLAQAQIGVAKLQSLANVDVVRWGYMQMNPDLRGRVPIR